MAESLDDAEFWLPPQFLADDDVFPPDPVACGGTGGPGLGFGFPFGASSDLSSPVGSSEAESSDDDDFLAGITLQISRSTLDDTPYGKNDAREAWNLSGSPQSTLCCAAQGSSRGSPNAATSRVSSPPPPPIAPAPAPATWDLLNAAAGEVAKIRTVAAEEEDEKLIRRNPSSDNLHRQYQFEQLRQIQILKQQQLQQLRLRKIHQQQYQTGRTLGLPNSAWPTLQQAQSGSGMRAIFLGNRSAGKRECAGTGVFLPRQVGAQPETRKKPACSTVLLPARVVQAMNLNLEEMGNPQLQVQPRFNWRVAPEADVTTIRLRSCNNNNYNNNNVVSNQKRNARPQRQVNHEIRLPQDWTY